jgi:hypothetical protein
VERFDDVELRLIEEEPAPPRPPRRSARWGLALVASVLTAGALAAGAFALTGSGGDSARPAAKQRLHTIHRHAAGLPCDHVGAGAFLSTAPRD